MLKREHIKQAIDAIAGRSPEIGYSLQEMFAAGRIDAAPQDRGSPGDGLYFLFEDKPLQVPRFVFFNEGTAPIEARLLIEYGQMRKKHALRGQEGNLDYRKATEEIHSAGLDFLVNHEIDRLLGAFGPPGKETDAGITPLKTALQGADAPAANQKIDAIRVILQKIREESPDRCLLPEKMSPPAGGQVLFQGSVGNEVPAAFVAFPFCKAALMQVAELNLEFFHVRLLLHLLAREEAHRLFACRIGETIAGLVLLKPRERFLCRQMEIRYIAAAASVRLGRTQKPLRGIGTFLVAGTWMLWKTRFPRFSELILDSEIGALRFYEGLGFRPRGKYAYVLKTPRGYLLDSIAAMAETCPDLPPRVLEEIAGYLKKTIRHLAASGRGGGEKSRKTSLRLVRRCLVSGRHRLLAQNAMAAVVRHRHRIAEAEELIGIGEQYGPTGDARQGGLQAPSLTVVCDPCYAEHLKGVFHMESTRRILAVEKALADPLLAGKWRPAVPRPASVKELQWVHGRSHIDKIAATAGKRLTSLDLDTQTTERSYEAALLAVGGVFTVIDEIFSGGSRRGFAFVRPPGHHAEPVRAMGFCLFNNTALGAQYLQRIYGLERVMIVDIDAHHGNGTQKAFYESKDVLFLSLHEFPGFPGTGNFGETGTGIGEGYTVNIPLPKGSRDRDFAQVVDALVRRIAEEYAPEALLVSCGFDLYQFDRLSGMNATAEGYAMMTRFLMEIAESVCAGRIVFILEGGYHLRGVEECARATLLELAGRSTLAPEKIDRIHRLRPDGSSPIGKAIEVQKKYWVSLRG